MSLHDDDPLRLFTSRSPEEALAALDDHTRQRIWGFVQMECDAVALTWTEHPEHGHDEHAPEAFLQVGPAAISVLRRHHSARYLQECAAPSPRSRRDLQANDEVATWESNFVIALCVLVREVLGERDPLQPHEDFELTSRRGLTIIVNSGSPGNRGEPWEMTVSLSHPKSAEEPLWREYYNVHLPATAKNFLDRSRWRVAMAKKTRPSWSSRARAERLMTSLGVHGPASTGKGLTLRARVPGTASEDGRRLVVQAKLVASRPALGIARTTS